MFKFLFLLLKLILLFLSKIITILLSCVIVFSLTSNPRAFKNNLFHKIIIMVSPSSTNSAYVMLIAFSFCLLYIEITESCLTAVSIPVWLLKIWVHCKFWINITFDDIGVIN